MGLDIYLYKCDDRSIGEKAEEACKAKTEPLWAALPNHETDPDGYDAAVANIEKVAAELGCDKYGSYTGPGAEERVNNESADPRFPDHVCNLGYLRSSYNDGGYNNVAEQRGWPTFYDIFKPGDDYLVTPDWAAALKTVDAALANVKPDDSKYYVIPFRGAVRNDCTFASSREALAHFIEQRDKMGSREDFRCFENAHGYINLDGTKVVAVLHAKQVGFLPPVAYLVCEHEKPEEDHYLQTLKITKAMIEYVLAQPDKEKYYFHWSG